MDHETFTFALADPLVEDSWIEVSGGGLQQPAAVRVAKIRGALALIGLRFDTGEVVTSTSLRQLRLGDLLDQLSSYLVDEWKAAMAEAMASTLLPGVFPGTRPAEGAQARFAVLDDLVGFMSTRVAREQHLEPRGRGADPPSFAELQRFARTYLAERAQRPRGAVTRTAERVGMSRSTAHRWINLCKQQDLLPNEEDA